MTSFNLNYRLKGLVSKYSHIGGLGFQVINFGAGTFGPQQVALPWKESGACVPGRGWWRMFTDRTKTLVKDPLQDERCQHCHLLQII